MNLLEYERFKNSLSADRRRAIYNYIIDQDLNRSKLSSLFFWSETPQGFNYWLKKHDNLFHELPQEDKDFLHWLIAPNVLDSGEP